MFFRNHWLICFGLCDVGCAARVDFSGMDAGARTGGASAVDGGGGGSTLSGGSSTYGVETCNANAEICETPVVLAANLQDACGIAVEAAYVYWTDCISQEVMRVSIDGGIPEILASGDAPRRIAVDSQYVYWTTVTEPLAAGAVMKVPLNGGTPITLTSVKGDPMGLAVNAARVFVATTTECITGTVGYELLSIPLDGGTPTTLLSDRSNNTHLINMAIDNANIYWSHVEYPSSICRTSGRLDWVPDARISKLPLGGGIPTVLASGLSQPVEIVANGTNVYWTDNTGYKVMSVPIVGGSPTTLEQSFGPNEPSGIAADATHVYWTLAGQHGEIRKASLLGGRRTILASNQHYPVDLAVDATNIYWVNFYSSVMKLRVH